MYLLHSPKLSLQQKYLNLINMYTSLTNITAIIQLDSTHYIRVGPSKLTELPVWYVYLRSLLRKGLLLSKTLIDIVSAYQTIHLSPMV